MLPLFVLIAQSTGQEWEHYGNDAGGMRYARLTQIGPKNVSKLKLAWENHSGEVPNAPGDGPSSNDEATPVYVDGTLIYSTPKSVVIAVDGDTGKERWRYDPKVPLHSPAAQEPFTSRGVAIWRGSGGKVRVLFGTYDARLLALDAKTGELCADFGKKGVIDLREGLGSIWRPAYCISSPPAIVGDLVVTGSSIADNMQAEMPSGMLRAFDVRTGALRWTWDPLGRAQSPFDPKRPYLPGAANAWSILSVDAARDLIFVPTGSQSPDFYGGLRPGDNRCANSISAIQASTGKLKWSFQVVHHDVWDYDVPAQPILAEVKGQPAVIALTKMGHIFVLNRESGVPIFPVEERTVPTSDVPGEALSPTQPFPTMPKPLVPSQLTDDQIWAITPKEREFVRNKVKGMRNEGIFTPPSLQGTVLFPGNVGGCNWSGGSFDPQTQTLYVNTNRIATLITLIPKESFSEVKRANPGVEITAQFGAPLGVRRDWLFAHGGVPGNKPPWGTFTAVDLNSGKARWEVPLGSMPSLADLPGSEKYGSINFGGSMVTESGLVFIAASLDAHLRAFSAKTGEVLWSVALPTGGHGAPMTYRSKKTGRQYIVQIAGGHHGLGTKNGDSILAYALP